MVGWLVGWFIWVGWLIGWFVGRLVGWSIRAHAIHQIMVGWRTYEYYYETDELPNPRPTQPKKK